MKALEEIYQEIADYIVAVIPEPWTTASIDIDARDADVFFMEGRYRRPSAAEPGSFHVNFQVAQLFRDMRERMRQDNAAPWRRANFTMERDGRFDLKLE